MTTYQNKLSKEESPLKLDPETIVDLDPEKATGDLTGGAGIPSKNANGLKNC